MNFTFIISEEVVLFNEESMRVINIHLEITSGKIPVKSLPLQVRVINGSTIVSAWMCQISGNQKEIDAWFTLDAFAGFSSNSTLAIGYEMEPLALVENVDVTSFASSAPTSGVIDATNAWLQNIISNQ